MATPNLAVGYFIGFQLKAGSQAIYNGTVQFCDARIGYFRIEGVMRQETGEDMKVLIGSYGFFLNDVENLHVIMPFLDDPEPEPTTDTKKDDQKRDPDSGASSSAASTVSSK